jgi:hypothetical protein
MATDSSQQATCEVFQVGRILLVSDASAGNFISIRYRQISYPQADCPGPYSHRQAIISWKAHNGPFSIDAFCCLPRLRSVQLQHLVYKWNQLLLFVSGWLERVSHDITTISARSPRIPLPEIFTFHLYYQTRVHGRRADYWTSHKQDGGWR